MLSALHSARVSSSNELSKKKLMLMCCATRHDVNKKSEMCFSFSSTEMSNKSNAGIGERQIDSSVWFFTSACFSKNAKIKKTKYL